MASHCTSTLVTASIFLCLSGCGNISSLTKPEDPYYATATSDYFEKVDENLLLKISCIPENSSLGSNDKSLKSRQCLYKSVDESYSSIAQGGSEIETKLSSYFANCPRSTGISCETARNRIIDVLVKITSDNCSTFMQRTFLAKSTSDSAYSFARDGLSGGTAAVAIASPPAAVGLSLGSLVLRSYESFNKTFFLNEAFQPLENAINLSRTEKRDALKTTCEFDNSETLVPYSKCSINKSLTMIKEYGDACSLRVGLNKLQSLVHQSKNRQEVEKLDTDRNALIAEKEKLQKELMTAKSTDKLGEFSKQLETLQNSVISQQRAIEKVINQQLPAH